jgi:hypothetical protein
MISINLIPRHRRMLKRRRRRLRAWSAGLGAYAAVIVAALPAARLFHAGDLALLQREADRAGNELSRQKALRGSVEKELCAARLAAQAVAVKHELPDWSLLLAALDRCLESQIMLRSCQLSPGLGPGRGMNSAPGAAAAPPTVRLAGVGRSQAAVSQFLLRLEDLGLFERVTLSASSREPQLEADAVSFNVSCVLGVAAETTR